MNTPASPVRRTALGGIERLLIDGTNLLHALRRGATPAPAATLIGRLRGVIEPAIRIELVFDGPPDRGLGDTRIASGITIRYSGRTTADDLIRRLVSEAQDSSTLLVVTDDGDLSDDLRRRGARTARTEWLAARLDQVRLVAPTIGRPKPPRSAPGATDAAEANADQRGWQPGRGATAKKGNPKRRPRSAGRPDER